MPIKCDCANDGEQYRCVCRREDKVEYIGPYQGEGETPYSSVYESGGVDPVMYAVPEDGSEPNTGGPIYGANPGGQPTLRNPTYDNTGAATVGGVGNPLYAQLAFPNPKDSRREPAKGSAGENTGFENPQYIAVSTSGSGGRDAGAGPPEIAGGLTSPANAEAAVVKAYKDRSLVSKVAREELDIDPTTRVPPGQLATYILRDKLGREPTKKEVTEKGDELQTEIGKQAKVLGNELKKTQLINIERVAAGTGATAARAGSAARGSAAGAGSAARGTTATRGATAASKKKKKKKKGKPGDGSPNTSARSGFTTNPQVIKQRQQNVDKTAEQARKKSSKPTTQVKPEFSSTVTAGKSFRRGIGGPNLGGGARRSKRKFRSKKRLSRKRKGRRTRRR